MTRRLNPLILKLGPIVGHTDTSSVRIWIQASGDPESYALRVKRRGTFPFRSTEQGGATEFGTAVAIASDLKPDTSFSYDILMNGRAVRRSQGSFRTMPPDDAFADVLFVSVSCSDPERVGAWPLLHRFIDEHKPRFLLMMGDQVYMDQRPDLWQWYADSGRTERRQAMAEKYRQHWDREPIREIMANIPTYMIWDDHDIRDGWGSWASDSQWAVREFPKWAPHSGIFNSYFEDARDLYWHFQLSHGATGFNQPIPAGIREARPYGFRCGRLFVFVTDGRGDRDFLRAGYPWWGLRPREGKVEGYPVLGRKQWEDIDATFAHLSANIDALAVVTAVPIVAMDPDGPTMDHLKNRGDDVELVKSGKVDAMRELMYAPEGSLGSAILERYTLGVHQSDFKISELDDARDSWAHPVNQPEQERLIRSAVSAAHENRRHKRPRSLTFLGGDIHAGAIFDLWIGQLDFKTQSLVASAISQKVPEYRAWVGLVGDAWFPFSNGMVASQKTFVRANNFGVTRMIVDSSGATMHNLVVHEGEAEYGKLHL